MVAIVFVSGLVRASRLTEATDNQPLSQSFPAETVSSLLDGFYDECAAAIWECDGLLSKTVGDAITAIFNFPIGHDDHTERAMLAAREIQRRWHTRRELFAAAGLGLAGSNLGIGIDTGETSFGEFGRSHRDLTAIRTVVNHCSSRPSSRRRRADLRRFCPPAH